MEKRTIEPLSMKMLSVLFYHCVGTERIGTKTRTVEIQSHRQSHMEESKAPSHAFMN